MRARCIAENIVLSFCHVAPCGDMPSVYCVTRVAWASSHDGVQLSIASEEPAATRRTIALAGCVFPRYRQGYRSLP